MPALCNNCCTWPSSTLFDDYCQKGVRYEKDQPCAYGFTISIVHVGQKRYMPPPKAARNVLQHTRLLQKKNKKNEKKWKIFENYLSEQDSSVDTLAQLFTLPFLAGRNTLPFIAGGGVHDAGVEAGDIARYLSPDGVESWKVATEVVVFFFRSKHRRVFSSSKQQRQHTDQRTKMAPKSIHPTAFCSFIASKMNKN